MQRELALLGELTNELRRLDAKLVALCDNAPQAYKLCIDQSKVYRTRDDLAALVGLLPSHFKQILNSDRSEKPKYMPPEAETKLQRVCSNTAPLQWREMHLNGLLNCQRTTADREAELLAELAKLRGVA